MEFGAPGPRHRPRMEERPQALRAERHERILGELVALYGEGEDTDWPYLTDLATVIVDMIERETAQ